MIKILANDGLEAAAVEKLRSKGIGVILDKVDQSQLAGYINSEKIKGLVVRSATKVRKDLIDACPELKLIGRAGVGMDNIDVDYAVSKGIQVVNTPAASSQSVAELVLAHLFCVARCLHDSNRKMPLSGEGQFNDLKKDCSKGFELQGKTLGILGFGRIGQAVAKLAIGLGMKVMPYDPIVKRANLELDLFHLGDTFEIEFDTVPLEDVFAASDFITLHVPMPPDGSPVISDGEFARMKKGVCIINTARGGIVDEQSLLRHLDSGKVAFAGLDVFENEPKPMEVLVKHPKISLSPHIGGSTVEAQERIGEEIADKIISFFS